jgi:hypothetical protein
MLFSIEDKSIDLSSTATELLAFIFSCIDNSFVLRSSKNIFNWSINFCWSYSILSGCLTYGGF